MPHAPRTILLLLIFSFVQHCISAQFSNSSTTDSTINIFGLPANFTFAPLDRPLVIDGVAQIELASEVQPNAITNSVPKSFSTIVGTAALSDYWMANLGDHGNHPLAPAGYPWYRNVMDYGAKGIPNASCERHSYSRAMLITSR